MQSEVRLRERGEIEERGEFSLQELSRDLLINKYTHLMAFHTMGCPRSCMIRTISSFCSWESGACTAMMASKRSSRMSSQRGMMSVIWTVKVRI